MDTLKVVHLVGQQATFKNGSRKPMGYFMVTKLMEFFQNQGYSASISIIF
jgi:hypothetical protein